MGRKRWIFRDVEIRKWLCDKEIKILKKWIFVLNPLRIWSNSSKKLDADRRGLTRIYTAKMGFFVCHRGHKEHREHRERWFGNHRRAELCIRQALFFKASFCTRHCPHPQVTLCNLPKTS